MFLELGGLRALEHCGWSVLRLEGFKSHGALHQGLPKHEGPAWSMHLASHAQPAETLAAVPCERIRRTCCHGGVSSIMSLSPGVRLKIAQRPAYIILYLDPEALEYTSLEPYRRQPLMSFFARKPQDPSTPAEAVDMLMTRVQM